LKERTHFLRAFLILLVVIATGTIGYSLIESWSLTDALYMTIITISTVGYAEVHPLSDGGRIFSAILIVCGVGAMLYALTSIIEYLIRGQLRILRGRSFSMEERISKLKGHYIIYGYGRVGKVIAKRFKNEGVDFVVLDDNPDAITQAEAEGYLCTKGDPSLADNLIKAGIERARGILVVADNDAFNTFTIVTARKIRPDIYIVARAGMEESESKLEMVGADKALNPYSSMGERMARIALHPLVSDFIEDVLPGPGKDQYLEGVQVEQDSNLCGITIAEAQKNSQGAVILAIRKKGRRVLAKPSEDTIIEQGDRLVVLGTEEQLSRMEHLLESD
jgi:voltage-gated potassium channel